MIDEPSAFAFIDKLPLPMIKDKEMNANELADRLKLVRCLAGDGQVLNKAEAMLRQQQAEIEALKNRELTDEEIWELAKEIGWKEVMIPLIIPLGRAILRKAQEK